MWFEMESFIFICGIIFKNVNFYINWYRRIYHSSQIYVYYGLTYNHAKYDAFFTFCTIILTVCPNWYIYICIFYKVLIGWLIHQMYSYESFKLWCFHSHYSSYLLHLVYNIHYSLSLINIPNSKPNGNP